MKKKNRLMRSAAVLLALLLTVSNISVPSVYATDVDSENVTVTDTEAAVSTEDTVSADVPDSAEPAGAAETAETDPEASAELDQSTEELAAIEQAEKAAAAEEEAVAESNAEVTEPAAEDTPSGDADAEAADPEEAAEDPAAGETAEDAVIGELKLVYGDEDLSDEDALVLLIMGDGFTAEEQDKFYEEAANTAEYVMACSPYDEFTDVFKIYALGVVSNESGARGEDAGSQEEAEADVCDTYFESTFWSYGMQRLLTLSAEGEAKGEALKEEYLPLADYNVYIVNSATYGGSGGSYCVASLNTQSLEMMLHEMGHTIGGLSDEYYAAGYEAENVNLTQESDPEKVSWARFVGKNGVGVYDWGGMSGIGWYIPHTGCKMQFLGAEYEFCEVCKEQLRKSFCADSNVTKLFFQTYADEFLAGEGKDMSEYFILRRGSAEITGDELGDALTLTYYDEAGNKLESIPGAAGTYTVKAEFAGNDTYAACAAEGSYTIDAVSISLNVSSKSQDGKPADLNVDVACGEGDSIDNYTFGISYSGYQYYTYYVYDWYESCTYTDTLDTGDDVYDVYYCRYDSYADEYLAEEEYQSSEGPTEPGSYTVTFTVYDGDYNVVAEKSKEYSIHFNTTRIVDNNDYDDYYGYYGATDYGNNKNILIYGEGFTEKEQKKFLKLANQFAEGILATEPFKETKLYFNFTAVNCYSEESGIGTEAKDTFFQLTYDENGALIPSYDATNMATYLGYYDINPYYDECIVIVNDRNAKESSTYFYDYEDYYSFHTIFATPDLKGIAYTAKELLNHLVVDEVGYRAKTKAEREAQRLALIDSMYYDYAPVIVSRAYSEIFVENGAAVDLTSSFHVYYGDEELADVPLKLTYYTDDHGKPGTALEEAPSKAGIYHVLAETVPYDPENPYEDYWTWYQPEGADEEDGLWLGRSRGWTTFTIWPGKITSFFETHCEIPAA